MRTIREIKNQFLVRNQANTLTAFYTDTIIDDWTDAAHKWAAGFHKWPATEGRVNTTYTSANEEWQFEGYKSDSFRFIRIGDERLQKVNFEDYQIYREEETSGDDRIYSDFAGSVFINPNADVSGTLSAFGQFTPRDFDSTDPDETTVFSSTEEEANEAIVEKMMSYARLREHKEAEAKQHHDTAVETLEAIWTRITDEQYAYQGHDRGIWERIDVQKGALRDDLFRRDQWY